MQIYKRFLKRAKDLGNIFREKWQWLQFFKTHWLFQFFKNVWIGHHVGRAGTTLPSAVGRDVEKDGRTDVGD